MSSIERLLKYKENPNYVFTDEQQAELNAYYNSLYIERNKVNVEVSSFEKVTSSEWE